MAAPLSLAAGRLGEAGRGLRMKLRTGSLPLLRCAGTRPARPGLAPLQGIIKPALQRLRDSYAARARELADEMLSLQVRLRAGM